MHHFLLFFSLAIIVRCSQQIMYTLIINYSSTSSSIFNIGLLILSTLIIIIFIRVFLFRSFLHLLFCFSGL